MPGPEDLQYDLLLKDVALLAGEIGAVPVTELSGAIEKDVLVARGLLAPR